MCLLMTLISTRWLGMSSDLSPLSTEKKLIIEKHSVKIRREIKGKMRPGMGGAQSVNVFSTSETFCSLAYFVAKTSQEQQRYCRA